MREDHISRTECEEWVSNDEGLYDLWQESNLPLSRFINQNYAFIKEVAKSVKGGERKPHYLKYG